MNCDPGAERGRKNNVRDRKMMKQSKVCKDRYLVDSLRISAFFFKVFLILGHPDFPFSLFVSFPTSLPFLYKAKRNWTLSEEKI